MAEALRQLQVRAQNCSHRHSLVAPAEAGQVMAVLVVRPADRRRASLFACLVECPVSLSFPSEKQN